jgi:predicted nucleotidyltransferase
MYAGPSGHAPWRTGFDPVRTAVILAPNGFEGPPLDPERQRPSLNACQTGMATLPSMHSLIEAHRAELLALARGRGVTGVRVFGSMSRGDGSDNSDVDLLVTLAPGVSALALGGLLMDAQELLGRRVDVVTEASLHPALRERVLADAVPL